MFWHPLLLAVFSTSLVAFFLLLAAGVKSLRIAVSWQPKSVGSQQLSLEAAAESASIQGRAAFWLFLFSAASLIFGIANVFPENIPGAMCGTGVCQAMSMGGARLLIATGLLLLVLYLWRELDKLNRQQTNMPLTEMNARFFLVLPPVAVLTLIETYNAFAGIDPHRPVDCCAIVYDQFSSMVQARTISGLDDTWWIGGFIVLSILLFCLGVSSSVITLSNRKVQILLAAVSWLWLPVAALTLVNVLSAYHYEVLHHRCPWCLFLPEHGMVGYPLYGAMWFIGMEGVTILVPPRMVNRDTTTYNLAVRRCVRAARCITISTIIFLIFALAPIIIWRIRYGVWMSN